MIKKKKDILAQCIEEILSGESTVEDCLARYPKLSHELRPLLKIAANIQPEEATPSPEFVERVRGSLFEINQPTIARRVTSEQHKTFSIYGRLSLRLSAAITILALVFAGGSTAYAAQKSLPEDLLYPVKICLENTQMAFTPSPKSKASLHLQLQERRLLEVVAQSSLGEELSPSAVEAASRHIDTATRGMSELDPEDAKGLLSQLSESTLIQQAILNQVLKSMPDADHDTLEQALDVTRRGNVIAEVAYDNPAFLKCFPSVSDEGLDSDCFVLEGTLLSAKDGNWNIGGLLLNKVVSTEAAPVVGSTVEIRGLVHDDEVFVSRIEHLAQTKSQANIEGGFNGISPDGAVWYVSHIPVSCPLTMTLPEKGSRVRLMGNAQDGAFFASGSESTEHNEAGIRVNGTLVGVNRGENSIVIEVGGFRTTVNVSKALTEGGDGRFLTMSDLESLEGEDIEAGDVSREDGHFYARNVRVDVDEHESDREATEHDRQQSEESTRDSDGEHDSGSGDHD